MGKKIVIASLLIIVVTFGFLAFNITGSVDGLGQVSEMIVDKTKDETGAINSVTATVFGFRGYDTLGESIVLFTAICGVAAVLRTPKKTKEDK